ncbi:hypothetical protein HanRHA438_Chr15g0734351 [Helianthus annuus]|nr:hypothetical protein HanRHA438_Chr15g0734351 [Helianthus annuus]
MYCKTWVLSHVFNIMKIRWFYSDKIFPNYGPDEKNSAAKLINIDTTETGSRPPAPEIGVGGCDRRWYQSYATGSSQRSVLLTLKF